MNQGTEQFSEPTARWFGAAFGKPTEVQKKTWPAVIEGKPVLVSAPTGTGKTLSAFLVFIDRLKAMARAGELEDQLYLIYVSPLKSLAGDIRENLRRPLEGIGEEEAALYGAKTRINVAVRTGDTPQQERQKMAKRPPHILIITPESLYLMLTSKSGRSVLRTAKALIIDELHAMIDTKRGAHLMLSIARLDHLCGVPVQRIGLSATIKPLALAAAYLSPEKAVVAAPPMSKTVRIEIKGTLPRIGRRKDPVWEELAAEVYRQCQGSKSVIAFSEGRRYAEKIAYYVNQLGGEGFARVHHGSLSKEQRTETEQALRDGSLRLLCATSSMELGIDVGEIDQVLQVGCPRTISSTMQRLGRAGHNPGRISYMYMYPRTAPEGLYCGMTAQIARQGGVEQAAPPKMCLDVLAQHLVSMASETYTVDKALEILQRAYAFQDITRQDIKDVLSMLAGDYEHRREIPARPRVLYDRIHETVSGDAYSRMLAVAAGGTIPDKGLYAAKTEDGVKLGELDEEFVYETRIGDKIVLGSFAWKIVKQDRDAVIVAPTSTDGARLPFWKGEIKGRSLHTSLAFGKMIRGFAEGIQSGTLMGDLAALGMNVSAAESAADFLHRQIAATGALPDDRTIIVEHFTDYSGTHQIMVHALYGKRINTPLSMLMQHAAAKALQANVGCVDEEDGFLLYPYGTQTLPEGLIFMVSPAETRQILDAMLPVTPVFNMTFRYNAARALMMGMKNQGRQPLWLQRLKSAEMLDSLRNEKKHPLIRETKRECLEDLWDIQGLLEIINGIQSGMIRVREVYTETPSPMSLPLQWQVEAAEMYAYSPTPGGLLRTAFADLDALTEVKPGSEELQQQGERKKYPKNADELHSLLMMEGDLQSEELTVLDPVLFVSAKEQAQATQPGTQERQPEEKTGADLAGSILKKWLDELISREQIAYIEPGLWIAAEQREEYEKALILCDQESLASIVRRALYYRGAMSAEQICERYFLTEAIAAGTVKKMLAESAAVEDQGVYYHAKLYTRAQKATIRRLREQTATQPPEAYAAMIAALAERNAAAEEQLAMAVKQYRGQAFPAEWWERVIFARRVNGYAEHMLDQFLAKGEYFWRFCGEGKVSFERHDDVDWDGEAKGPGAGVDSGIDMGTDSGMDTGRNAEDHKAQMSTDESLLYRQLCRRGASFMQAFNGMTLEGDLTQCFLSLAAKGYICADSFVPVRQWLNRDTIKKAAPRARVNARMVALSAGRWDIVRPLQDKSMEEWLEQMFDRHIILCKETYGRPESGPADGKDAGWSKALDVLRIWEYTGRVRRGYYVAGMSGAQFVRAKDYEGVVLALKRYAAQNQAGGGTSDIVWLNASDPSQIWGKALTAKEGKAFMNLPGTLVALCGGLPVVFLERQGNVLRFDEREQELAIETITQVMKAFTALYKQKKLFSDKRRIIIKKYPEKAKSPLENAGFQKEALDYVLYRL